MNAAKAHLNSNLTNPSAEADGNKVTTHLKIIFLIAVHFSERICAMHMDKGF